MRGTAVFLTVSWPLTPIEEIGDNEPLVLVDAVPSVKGWKDGVLLKHFCDAFPRNSMGNGNDKKNATPMPQGLTLPRMQRLIDIMDSVQLRCNLAS